MERNVIRLTNDYIIRNEHWQLPLDLETVKEMCLAHGFTVCKYSQAIDIIKSNHLEYYAERNKSLVLQKGELKFILYRDGLTLGMKLHCILHELGHIVLDHSGFDAAGAMFNDARQEAEADAFADQMMAPLCVLRHIGAYAVFEIQEYTSLDYQEAREIAARLWEPGTNNEPLADELIDRYESKKDIVRQLEYTDKINATYRRVLLQEAERRKEAVKEKNKVIDGLYKEMRKLSIIIYALMACLFIYGFISAVYFIPSVYKATRYEQIYGQNEAASYYKHLDIEDGYLLL